MLKVPKLKKNMEQRTETQNVGKGDSFREGSLYSKGII